MRASTRSRSSWINWKQNAALRAHGQGARGDQRERALPADASRRLRPRPGVRGQQVAVRQVQESLRLHVGTPGATPFASAVTDATNVRKALNQQLCPLSERRGVVDFSAAKRTCSHWPSSATPRRSDRAPIKIEGEIGRKYGIDWYADDEVVTHTAGTGWRYDNVCGTPPSAPRPSPGSSAGSARCRR
jgi:hypothetical protein